MKRFAAFLFALMAALPGRAQTPFASAIAVTGANGQTFAARSVQIEGNSLVMIQAVDNGTVTVRWPLSAVKEIQAPVPAETAASERLMAEGKTQQAVDKIAPVLAAWAPFKKIKGAPWLRAALAKAKCLLVLKRTAEANALLGEIDGANRSDETLYLQALGAHQAGDMDKALELLKPLTRKDAPFLGESLMLKGETLAKKNRHDLAALAFLQASLLCPKFKAAGEAKSKEAVASAQLSR